MTIQHCKCANNVNGLCYGNCSSSYQNQVQRGETSEYTAKDGNKAFAETDCPGYIKPGQPMYVAPPQGDTIVPPFN